MKHNSQGGLSSEDSKDQLERAKDVDLVTLPTTITGTNCYNCKWIKDKTSKIGYCSNPKVAQYVNNRMCCAIWDSTYALRNFNGKSDLLK